MRPVLFVFGLFLVLGNASCPQQVQNPADCTYDDSICTNAGLSCDPKLHQCVAVAGCLTAAMCSSPSASACIDSQCAACTTDAQCGDWSRLRNATPQRNFCVSLGQQNTCSECRPGLSETDCPDPMSSICDATLALCRPCRADKDCASRICRKLGDYPEVSPVPGVLTGQCVPSSQISYVDQDNPACQASGTSSTPAQPLCSVTAAFNTGLPYISIAPSRMYYPELNLNMPGKIFVMVGPNADTRSYAYYDRITVTNGTLVLANIYLAPITAGNAQINCIGSQSSVYVTSSNMVNANKIQTRLIDASKDCGQITVDRMLMSCLNLAKSALLIGGTGTVTTNYRVVNTAIASCGGAAEPYAIQISDKAQGYFGFNNIYGNYRGIQCTSSSQTIVNSIVAANALSQIDGCTFDPAYNLTDVDKIDAPSAPFLQPTGAKNTMNVVDKALAPAASQLVPIDFDGNPRPQGKGYDIGIQELK